MYRKLLFRNLRSLSGTLVIATACLTIPFTGFDIASAHGASVLLNPSSHLIPGNHLVQEKEWVTEGPEAVSSMLGHLQMLNMRSARATPEQQLADLRTLLVLSDDLANVEAEPVAGQPDHRMIAFQVKAQSLLSLISANEEGAREKLDAFVESSQSNPDTDYQKSALFLKLTVALNDVASKAADSSLLTAQVESVINRFPNDPTVANRMLAVADQLVASDNVQASSDVLKVMDTSYAAATGEEFSIVKAVVKDRIHLAEIGFVGMVKAIQSDPGGEHDAFVQVVNNLADRKGMGRKLYFEIVNATRWMETNGRSSEAVAVFEKLKTTLEGNSDEMIVSAFEKDSEMSARRLASVGAQFAIAGQDETGTDFDMSMVEGKKVIGVFFWSADAPQSVQAMGAMLQVRSAYVDKGFEMVAICTDKDPARARSMLANRSPPWISLYQTEERHREFTTSLGAQGVPFMVLMDGNQTVLRSRVSLQTVTQALSDLLGPPDRPSCAVAPGDPRSGG